jgi:hypothetical protein
MPPRKMPRTERTSPPPTVVPDLEEIGELLDEKFGAFKDALPSMLEPILEPIITARVEAVLAAVRAEVSAKFERQQSIIETLINRVNELEGRSDDQDKASRVNNLIVKNWPEEGDQGGHRVLAGVVALFPSGSLRPAILEARRLGRQREQPDAPPRPVLVKFASNADKHAALGQSRNLRAKRIYLDDDLTPRQQRMRASKRNRFLLLKGQGANPFWRGEHLFFY